MNESDIAMSLGEIKGELTGINREIKGIKDMFSNQGSDCKECRGQIDKRIEGVVDRIDTVERTHIGQGAVLKFMNSVTGMSVMIGGFIIAILSFLIAIGVI